MSSRLERTCCSKSSKARDRPNSATLNGLAQMEGFKSRVPRPMYKWDGVHGDTSRMHALAGLTCKEGAPREESLPTLQRRAGSPCLAGLWPERRWSDLPHALPRASWTSHACKLPLWQGPWQPRWSFHFLQKRAPEEETWA